jgi:2-polyprenyl-6-methoxyphenol hydroxylase-like FAD-dependent oxidoreductase
VGCVAALALARGGASVLLLEGNATAAQRLAGEWLHPRGARILRELGLELPGEPGCGFALFPEDGGPAVLLPYEGEAGLSCEHEALVSVLRQAAAGADGVTFLPATRVLGIDGTRLELESGDVLAGRIVGTDGRASLVRRSAGISGAGTTVSAMAGVVLEGAELPFEGFGHVLLGGPGPVLVYRLGPGRLRACIDVPGRTPRPRDAARTLWEGYGHAFPPQLGPAFREALESGTIAWAANRFRRRTKEARFGTGGLVLAGDAAGYYHPLTAVGMTLGFADALEAATLAPADYRRRRAQASRAPELLATALYAAFTRKDGGTAALRRAMVAMWADPGERRRTMRLLSTDEERTAAFYRSFAKVVALTAEEALRRRRPGSLDGFGWWLRWLTVGRLGHQAG